MNFTSMGNPKIQLSKPKLELWLRLKPPDEVICSGGIPATTCQLQQVCPLACRALLSSRLVIGTRFAWLEEFSSKPMFRVLFFTVFSGPLAAWEESGEIYKVKTDLKSWWSCLVLNDSRLVLQWRLKSSNQRIWTEENPCIVEIWLSSWQWF